MEPIFLLLFITIFPLLGSAIGFVIGYKHEKSRDIFNIFMTGITFVAVVMLWQFVSVDTIEIKIDNIMGTGLYLKLDIMRYIFIWLTTFIWFLTTVYSTQYLINYKNRNRYYLFFMLTLWSTIGIFLSENLLNLFTFFEIMSLTSYPLIIHDEDRYAHNAGDTYITMAIAGGLVLLMGLFLVYDYTGTLVLSDLRVHVQQLGNIKYVMAGLIIAGFGVKAGMFPLHVWLPKAYTAAPTPATAVLSGILKKTGIFGILITSEFILGGDIKVSFVLLILGFITMFLGGFLAMFQRNVKRILAYSSMSQMGYIIVGIALMGLLGEDKNIAYFGTLYHVINHAIFKVLLFMGAGIVYMVLHELSINKIGGFGRKKNLLKIMFLIGLFAIIGMPGFAGFTSKTLLHHALSEAHHIYGGWFILAEVVFTLSSAFTVAYLMKIFVAVFVEESNHDLEKVKAKITKRALLPMIILGGLTIFIGMKPQFIMSVLERSLGSLPHYGVYEEFDFYTIDNIKTSLFTIFLGIFIYFAFVRKVLRKGKGICWSYENITLNWFNINRHIYRPLGKGIIHSSSRLLKVVDESLTTIALVTSTALESIGKKEIEVGKFAYVKTRKKVRKALDVKINLSDTTENLYTEKDIAAVTHIVEEEEKFLTTTKDAFNRLRKTFNSVTYSVFVFATVLVTILLILVL